MGEDGCTALVVVCDLKSNAVVCGNLGDCRCVMFNGSLTEVAYSHLKLSHDHKASDPEEKKRIEAAGHSVEETVALVRGQRVKVARVDGIIAVARSVGDYEFKGGEPQEQAVSCWADIQTAYVSDGTTLIMASDGTCILHSYPQDSGTCSPVRLLLSRSQAMPRASRRRPSN